MIYDTHGRWHIGMPYLIIDTFLTPEVLLAVYIYIYIYIYIDGIVQERRNTSALAMELHLSCTNPSICNMPKVKMVTGIFSSSSIFLLKSSSTRVLGLFEVRRLLFPFQSALVRNKMNASLYRLSITLTQYMVLPLFATSFADYAGGIRVSFI